MQTTSTKTVTTSQRDVRAKIADAISPMKELRFLFESEGNLLALHSLEATLLAEHTLLEITMWSVAQQSEEDNA
jgi:hypothetical protein